MDLRADILPPPEFIIETHLTVLQVSRALKSDPGSVDSLLKKLKQLRSDYDDRPEPLAPIAPFYDTRGNRDPRRDHQSLKAPVDRYFELLSNSWLPATQAHDVKTCDELIDKSLTPLYNKHKAIIDRLGDLLPEESGPP